MRDEGNVVIGYTSTDTVMLDVDLQMESRVRDFAEKYSKAHNLGGYVILETSKSPQIDLFGNRLGNFAIIYGKHLTWEGIQWHIDECRRLRIINRSFAVIRKFGSITIRVNAKNDNTPAPRVICSKYGKKDKAIKKFLDYYEMCKAVGIRQRSLISIECNS